MNVRLVGTDEVERQDHKEVSTLPNRTMWWLVGFLVLQSTILFLHSSANRHELNESTKLIRQELDENAKLIKQLQERIIVKDLSNLRKGMP